MKCKNCGKENSVDLSACEQCGISLSPSAQAQAEAAARRKGSEEEIRRRAEEAQRERRAQDRTTPPVIVSEQSNSMPSGTKMVSMKAFLVSIVLLLCVNIATGAAIYIKTDESITLLQERIQAENDLLVGLIDRSFARAADLEEDVESIEFDIRDIERDIESIRRYLGHYY